MEKTKKEQAIKKLQAELKQEKQDEIKRYVPPPLHTQQQRATLCTSACMHASSDMCGMVVQAKRDRPRTQEGC